MNDQPAARWHQQPAWQSLLFGVGLYDQFLAVELVTGYYQLYFDTGEGYEPIDIYTTFERLDEAAFAILKTLNT